MANANYLDLTTSDQPPELEEDVVFVGSSSPPTICLESDSSLSSFSPDEFVGPGNNQSTTAVGTDFSDEDSEINDPALVDWNYSPAEHHDPDVRFTCVYCSFGPEPVPEAGTEPMVMGRFEAVANLRSLVSHWLRVHSGDEVAGDGSSLSSRRSSNSTASNSRLPFRFGLERAVHCHKCKRTLLLSSLQSHYDEQHTAETFAVGHCRQPWRCALCPPSAAATFDCLQGFFAHCVQRHQQPASQQLPVTMADWLDERQLQRLLAVRHPSAQIAECWQRRWRRQADGGGERDGLEWSGPVVEMWECGDCDWQSAVEAEMMAHVLGRRCRRSGGAAEEDGKSKMIAVGRIWVFFANGLVLTKRQLANTTFGSLPVISELPLPAPNDTELKTNGIHSSADDAAVDADDDHSSLLAPEILDEIADTVSDANTDTASVDRKSPSLRTLLPARLGFGKRRRQCGPRKRRSSKKRRRRKRTEVHIDLVGYSDESDELQMLAEPSISPIVVSENDSSGSERELDDDGGSPIDRKPTLSALMASEASAPPEMLDTRPLAELQLPPNTRFQCLECTEHFAELAELFRHFCAVHRGESARHVFRWAVDREVECSRCGAHRLLRRLREHCRAVHCEQVPEANPIAADDPSPPPALLLPIDLNNPLHCAICCRPATGHSPAAASDCLLRSSALRSVAAASASAALHSLQRIGYRGRLHCLNCRRSYFDWAAFQRHSRSAHPHALPLWQQRPDAPRLWCPVCRCGCDSMRSMLGHCYAAHWRRFGCLLCAANWFGGAKGLPQLRQHMWLEHGLRGERGWRLVRRGDGADGGDEEEEGEAESLMDRILLVMGNGMVVTRAEVSGLEEELQEDGGLLAGWTEQRVAAELSRMEAEELRDALQGSRRRGRGLDQLARGAGRLGVIGAGGGGLERRVRRDCQERWPELEQRKAAVLRQRRLAATAHRQRGGRMHRLTCAWCRAMARGATLGDCRRTLAVHARLNHPGKTPATDEDEAGATTELSRLFVRVRREADGSWERISCAEFARRFDIAPTIRLSDCRQLVAGRDASG